MRKKKISKSRKPSIRAKGRHYPIEISCTAWIDLLGYGSMLEKGDFDPSREETLIAVSRLQDFQNTICNKAERLFNTFIMNDGACIYRELTPRTSTVTHDFICKCIKLFNEVNEIESNKGFPGARMVIATGPRIRSKTIDLIEKSHLNSILKRLEDGIINSKQAIHEAYFSRSLHGITPELQANFAFTRAYIAESGGSKLGFKGANCFIDENILNNKNILGINIDEPIKLEILELNTIFYKIDSNAIESMNDIDFHNGLQICEKMKLDFRY